MISLRRFFLSVTLWAAGLMPLVPLQAEGTLRWSFATLSTAAAGNLLSSPALAEDGTVYLGIEVGLSTSVLQAGRLFALRPDGTQKWVYNAPDWIDSTPAIATDGTIYFGCWDGKLYALRPDGTLRWSLSLGSYISASPAIAGDGTIYIGTGDGDLCAVNPDGTLKWTYLASDWIESAPAVGADGTVYFGSWDKSFYAVRPDGTGVWRYATGGAILGSPAIGVDGTIIVGSRDLNVYAFRPDGQLRWTASLGDGIESSPAIGADGAVYVTTTGGRVFALSADGTERWRYPRAGQTALDPIYSSPALRADGSLVFGSSNNALYALAADGTLRFKATLGDWADSSPVVAADGSIYVGCYDKKLYAFDGSSGVALAGWPMLRRDAQRNGWQPAGAAAGTSGRLVNLSVRTRAGADADTLIVGFVVEGSGTKSCLVRGVGPTLATFGVTGAIADPRLAVYQGSASLGGNDNWGTATNLAALRSATTAVSAFALPENSLDAALLRDFAAGNYTVQVSGAQGGTGIALMEVYDVGGDATMRLGNLSARSNVGVGADVLIAGFVVSGQSRALLVRGVGPGLVSFGVPNTLADPQLKIFRGAQLVAENDNWGAASNAAAVAQRASEVYAFSLAAGSRDAALLLTLPPGVYSAQVAGGGATPTGVGLVEIYALP